MQILMISKIWTFLIHMFTFMPACIVYNFILKFNVHTPDEKAEGDLDASFFVGILVI